MQKPSFRAKPEDVIFCPNVGRKVHVDCYCHGYAFRDQLCKEAETVAFRREAQFAVLSNNISTSAPLHVLGRFLQVITFSVGALRNPAELQKSAA